MGPGLPPLDPRPMCIVTQLLLSAVAFSSVCLKLQKEHGCSLADRWSGLGTVCGPGSVPGPGTKTRKRRGSARRRQQRHVQVHVLFLSVKGRWRVRQHSVVTNPVCAANCSICVSWKRSVRCSATAVRSVKFFLPKGISRCCRVSLCWRWA